MIRMYGYPRWMNGVLMYEPSAKTPRSRMRNYRARQAVETLPPYVDSRSDNISLLGPNLAALRPFLKG